MQIAAPHQVAGAAGRNGLDRSGSLQSVRPNRQPKLPMANIPVDEAAVDADHEPPGATS
jgi:hypothetical protein